MIKCNDIKADNPKRQLEKSLLILLIVKHQCLQNRLVWQSFLKKCLSLNWVSFIGPFLKCVRVRKMDEV